MSETSHALEVLRLFIEAVETKDPNIAFLEDDVRAAVRILVTKGIMQPEILKEIGDE